MPSPRVIPIPKNAHNEIRLLMEKVNWTPDGIAQVASQLLLQVEKTRKRAESKFWSILQYIEPKVKELNQNVSFDIKSMRVVEKDDKGQDTGSYVEIPEAERRSIMIMLDDIDTASGAAKHVGHVIAGLNQESESSYYRLMSALSRHIPEVARGAWDVDIERMVVMERFDLEQAPEVQEPAPTV